MNGDNINAYTTANFRQNDGNQLQGSLAFGIDLSQPQLFAQTYPQSGRQNVFQVGEDLPNPKLTFNSENPFGAENVFQVPLQKLTVNNEGPIGSMSLPPGWLKSIPGAPPPGTYQFRVTQPGSNPFEVTSGQSFIPPDHIKDPSVEIHVGRNMDPVQPQAEAALRQVLQSKPATYGEQPLTAQEFKAVAPIMGAQDGGNNQFNDLGTHGPKFEVTSASTVNIQGKTALLVKGNFLNPDGSPSTRARESVFIDGGQTGTAPGAIKQVYLNAPPAKIQQYDHQFWNTVNSIQWAPQNQSQYALGSINE